MDAITRLHATDDATLVAEQARLGALRTAPWSPPGRPIVVAGCFVAFARGEEGPGHPGDHAWAGAVVVDEAGTAEATVTVTGVAPAAYVPGLLGRREGPLLLEAVEAVLAASRRRPDVLLVDATGRDHPRRAGLALHLGALLDLPTVGVTHRGLVDRQPAPALTRRGDRRDVRRGDEVVGAWVCTADGARPLLAHAAWRTDADAAVEVVLRTSHPGSRTLPGGTGGRTPEPLRQARQAARLARTEAAERDEDGPLA